MDHLEGRVVLHGCCGGAAAAWGLPLLPLDVLWPRRAAGPSDWLPQSAALSFCVFASILHDDSPIVNTPRKKP